MELRRPPLLVKQENQYVQYDRIGSSNQLMVSQLASVKESNSSKKLQVIV